MLITLARKPLVGSVVQNVLAHGCGALNIDDCRIGSEGGTRRDGKATMPNDAGWENMRGHKIASLAKGRWPANLLLYGQSAEQMDAQTGVLHPRGNINPTKYGKSFWGSSEPMMGGYFTRDVGGASRYFKQIKE